MRQYFTMPPVVLGLSICMCFIVLCGPRFATQSIAWTGMLISNVPTLGLAQGISNTFDNQHPCALCVQIEASSDTTPTPTHDQKKELRHLAQQALCTRMRLPTTRRILGVHGHNEWALRCHIDDRAVPPPQIG